MTSTEQAVNKILADLSKIPSEISSNSRIKGFPNIDIDEVIRRTNQVTEMELKKRGIL